MQKRKVIIHRHIFKNAGTTFDYILQNNFGDAFCDHRDDLPMRRGGLDYLMGFLERNQNIRALSSHHIWFNPPGHTGIELIPVVFLRHPIERIRSVYYFEQQQQSDTPGAIMAKKSDFKGYVAWYMQEEVPGTIRDFQTRFLIGVRPKIAITNQLFNFAIKTLESYTFFGIVDLFDESIGFLEKEFRQMGFNLNMSYIPQNVFQSFRETDYESRATDVLKELDEMAEIVCEKNYYDILLYRYARNKLINSIRHMNNPET